MREHQIVITLKPEQFARVQKLAREVGAKSMGVFVRQQLLAALGIEGQPQAGFSGGTAGMAASAAAMNVEPMVTELKRLHKELREIVAESLVAYSSDLVGGETEVAVGLPYVRAYEEEAADEEAEEDPEQDPEEESKQDLEEELDRDPEQDPEEESEREPEQEPPQEPPQEPEDGGTAEANREANAAGTAAPGPALSRQRDAASSFVVSPRLGNLFRSAGFAAARSSGSEAPGNAIPSPSGGSPPTAPSAALPPPASGTSASGGTSAPSAAGAASPQSTSGTASSPFLAGVIPPANTNDLAPSAVAPLGASAFEESQPAPSSTSESLPDASAGRNYAVATPSSFGAEEAVRHPIPSPPAAFNQRVSANEIFGPNVSTNASTSTNPIPVANASADPATYAGIAPGANVATNTPASTKLGVNPTANNSLVMDPTANPTPKPKPSYPNVNPAASTFENPASNANQNPSLGAPASSRLSTDSNPGANMFENPGTNSNAAAITHANSPPIASPPSPPAPPTPLASPSNASAGFSANAIGNSPAFAETSRAENQPANPTPNPTPNPSLNPSSPAVAPIAPSAPAGAANFFEATLPSANKQSRDPLSELLGADHQDEEEKRKKILEHSPVADDDDAYDVPLSILARRQQLAAQIRAIEDKGPDAKPNLSNSAPSQPPLGKSSAPLYAPQETSQSDLPNIPPVKQTKNAAGEDSSASNPAYRPLGNQEEDGPFSGGPPPKRSQ